MEKLAFLLVIFAPSASQQTQKEENGATKTEL
jgi:hypothetical protein